MKLRRETVKAEGFTLSQLVWALLRRKPDGFVELTLDINPGLADLGTHLPVGTVIDFPIEEANRKPAEKVVRLWD
jgi:phage tail protein X